MGREYALQTRTPESQQAKKLAVDIRIMRSYDFWGKKNAPRAGIVINGGSEPRVSYDIF